ncbi:MAG: peptidoglycan bridge formation glycyltransferase FemA/FemB family protein, partial [Spirochaetaceae bacterium]
MEAVPLSAFNPDYIRFVRNHAHGSLFQSAEWFAYQEATGNRPEAFLFFQDSLLVASCLYARRFFPFGLEYRYIPHGPLFTKPGHPDTFVSKSHERTNILDKGVEVKNSTSSNSMDTLYSILALTSARKKIPLPGKPIIEELFHHTNAHLFIANYNNEPVAAAIMVLWNRTAYFLYGASSGTHRNVMAPYLLHFSMMMEAKAFGMTSYDLMGVSPEDKSDHYLSEITRFKRQFGGKL